MSSVFFGLLCIAGNMSNAIYPLFVNALNGNPRTASVNIGSLASAEFLAFGLVILFAGKLLAGRSLRLTAATCLVVHLLTGYGTGEVPLALLIPCRLLYGAASGVLVWLAYAFVGRAPRPGRLAAVYTAALMCAAAALSWLGSNVVIPDYGNPAVFLFITVFSAIALVAMQLSPRELIETATTSDVAIAKSAAGPSAPPIFLLLSVGFLSAYMSVFWVYGDPLSKQLTGSILQYWLTVSLACQALGAMCAVVLVERLPCISTMAIGLGVLVLHMVAMNIGVGATAFVIWGGIYGFLGYFLIPFFVEAIARFDQTQRMVAFLPASQLLSASFGPMLVASLVSNADLGIVLKISFGFILISPVFLVAAQLLHKRSYTGDSLARSDRELGSANPATIVDNALP